MNRKDRRGHNSQNEEPPHVHWQGKAYTLEEAFALALDARVAGRLQEATQIFHAITIKFPNHPAAFINRGNILQELKRFEESLLDYRKAIALNPSIPEAYNNEGNSLQELRRLDDALASYDLALQIRPTYAMAHNNRGNVLQSLKRYEEALENYKRAYALDPTIPFLLGALIHTKMHLCDWAGLDADFQTLEADIKAGKPAASPFVSVMTPLSEATMLTCAQIYVQQAAPLAAMPLWNGKKYSHDRIRIGYFSSGLRNHPTAFLMAEFFERHDRSRFEVTAFSFAPPGKNDMRPRLEKAIEHFIDVAGKSELEIATLARKLEIDIAVDLDGLTEGARTGIFALRPAPVQVCYLGYPGSTGARYMDYLIADEAVIPKDRQHYYSEKIVYLPVTYQAVDSTRERPSNRFSRQEMGLPENGFVFCCFNLSSKITPDVFDVWMRLLHKVEGSVLWLLESNAGVSGRLRSEAEKRGIAPARLIFAPKLEMKDHLARHGLADLFLDTFHCNAHTTASDAVLQGLPLLTCTGEKFAARVATSILQAVDMPELITRSYKEYETAALTLAQQPEKLEAIRHKLRRNLPSSRLLNTLQFTRQFEAACLHMWQLAQTGQPPQHIVIQS